MSDNTVSCSCSDCKGKYVSRYIRRKHHTMANQGKVMPKVPDRSAAETSSSETSSALRPQKYIALQPAQSSSVDDGPSHSACSLTSSLLGEYDDDDDDPVSQNLDKHACIQIHCSYIS